MVDFQTEVYTEHRFLQPSLPLPDRTPTLGMGSPRNSDSRHGHPSGTAPLRAASLCVPCGHTTPRM